MEPGGGGGGRVSLRDVVRLESFHLPLEDMATYRRVKLEFSPERCPAATVVGVKALVDPRLLIEIQATAVIGSGRA